MTEFFVSILLSLNQIFFNNLGITIIFIAALSKLIFHPFIISNLRYTKAARDLKPRLDQLKEKHGGDMKKMATEQSRLFKEAGVSPAAGAIGCLSLVVQLVVFFILFHALLRLIGSGVDTGFLFWDLGQPDVFKIPNSPIPIPGILVIITGVLSLIQAKMMVVPVAKTQKKEGSKPDFADALSFQGQMVYLFPLIILFTGTRFPAGLVVYWLVTTLFGIIQQYQAVGLGGITSWVQKIRKSG